MGKQSSGTVTRVLVEEASANKMKDADVEVSINQSNGGVVTQHEEARGEPEVKDGCTCLKQRHILEKLVFVFSVVSLIFLAYSLATAQWLILYYYTVSLPILMAVRIVTYWKNKWQLFLIDFCYFGNAICYIYIWAAPGNSLMSTFVFGIANGPLSYAIVTFRNSLVFHSIDKMTSTFIHVIPMLVSYSVRWYPASISRYWYTPFAFTLTEEASYIILWVSAIPLACIIFHNALMTIFITVILRPSQEYFNSYIYITDIKCLAKVFNCCSGKLKPLIYCLLVWLYSAFTVLLAALCYKFFIAHSVVIAILLAVAVWNGASFYTDVFAYKGHKSESS